MIIECPNCNKKFNLDENLIPEKGRTLKCGICDHVWHYIISLNYEIENPKLSEIQNTDLDDTVSKIEKEEQENKETINDDALDSINEPEQEEINDVSEDEDEHEEVNDVSEDEDEQEEVNDEKKINIKIILVYILIFIISLIGVILLLDTFKMNVSTIFPSIIPIFDSLYETILDFKLFFIDLTN